MTSPVARVRLALGVAQALGPGWVAYRARHAVELRSGLLERRLPAVSWAELPLSAELTDPALADPAAYAAYRREGAPPFFFAPGDRPAAAPLLRVWDRPGVAATAVADDLERGVFRLFSRTPMALGSPPAWHRNPYTGQEAPADRHWSRLDDFAFGDVKSIWEASRFAFAYDLVRAYWRTGEESYAERFWLLVEDWRRANPPHRGHNWRCGQETSLRVMAWCFGLHGFLDAPATTPARLVLLAEMIALSGHRVEATIDYGLSQRNNHGVSEALGLWTIGALFPELRDAARWRERGRAILERLGRQLIDDDGAFSQQSVNYQRLTLHDYLWSLRLGELHAARFSDALYDRVGRAADLLYQLQDETTGQLPCYGANDGALVLPLGTSDYADYRPVIQATRYLTTRTRSYGDGAWDEDLLWLFGADALRAPVEHPPRPDLRAATAGYHTLRAPSGFAFTRAASFRFRPGHADLLHLDLWWRGVNVALDPGTYSYNAPAPWGGALAETAVHNTVTVDGRSQMDKVSRFLWLPWARGWQRFDAASDDGRLAYWEGAHDGYRRLADPVAHRRGVVRLGDEHWVVLDDLAASAPHAYRLHWLLSDPADGYELHRPAAASDRAELARVTMATSAGAYDVALGGLGARGAVSLARGEPGSTRGWRSPHYLALDPALSLALDIDAGQPDARLWTVLGPAGFGVEVNDGGLRVTWEGGAALIELGAGAAGPILRSVRMEGDAASSLVVAR